MRRTIYLLITLLLCMSIAIPAFAAEGTFVPSITYKDGPDVTSAQMDGDDVGGCLIVTTIKEAEEKSTDITQEERDTLLKVYEDLKAGEIKLPTDENYVIRELIDLSFKYENCRELEDHHRKDLQLKKEGVTLTVDFDLGVAKNDVVSVFVYIDGEWLPIESVVNNGDGTVTCVFEDICPVAFVVKQGETVVPPKTGDTQNIGLWAGLMVVSAVGLVALCVSFKKKRA